MYLVTWFHPCLLIQSLFPQMFQRGRGQGRRGGAVGAYPPRRKGEATSAGPSLCVRL